MDYASLTLAYLAAQCAFKYTKSKHRLCDNGHLEKLERIGARDLARRTPLIVKVSALPLD